MACAATPASFLNDAAWRVRALLVHPATREILGFVNVQSQVVRLVRASEALQKCTTVLRMQGRQPVDRGPEIPISYKSKTPSTSIASPTALFTLPNELTTWRTGRSIIWTEGVPAHYPVLPLEEWLLYWNSGGLRDEFLRANKNDTGEASVCGPEFVWDISSNKCLLRPDRQDMSFRRAPNGVRSALSYISPYFAFLDDTTVARLLIVRSKERDQYWKIAGFWNGQGILGVCPESRRRWKMRALIRLVGSHQILVQVLDLFRDRAYVRYLKDGTSLLKHAAVGTVWNPVRISVIEWEQRLLWIAQTPHHELAVQLSHTLGRINEPVWPLLEPFRAMAREQFATVTLRPADLTRRVNALRRTRRRLNQLVTQQRRVAAKLQAASALDQQTVQQLQSDLNVANNNVVSTRATIQRETTAVLNILPTPLPPPPPPPSPPPPPPLNPTATLVATLTNSEQCRLDSKTGTCQRACTVGQPGPFGCTESAQTTLPEWARKLADHVGADFVTNHEASTPYAATSTHGYLERPPSVSTIPNTQFSLRNDNDLLQHLAYLPPYPAAAGSIASPSLTAGHSSITKRWK